MITVGIVGMGVIGTHIAKAIDNGIPGISLVGVSVRNAATAGSYAVLPLDELIRRAGLVVEAGLARQVIWTVLLAAGVAVAGWRATVRLY